MVRSIGNATRERPHPAPHAACNTYRAEQPAALRGTRDPTKAITKAQPAMKPFHEAWLAYSKLRRLESSFSPAARTHVPEVSAQRRRSAPALARNGSCTQDRHCIASSNPERASASCHILDHAHTASDLGRQPFARWRIPHRTRRRESIPARIYERLSSDHMSSRRRTRAI